MAHLRQEQRQALEEVFRSFAPQDFDLSGAEFELEGKPLAYWGTSEGYGVCSRIHDVNVAILGDPTQGSIPTDSVGRVHYIFFLRPATNEEKSNYEKRHNILVMVVEMLVPVEYKSQKLVLARTSLKSCYVKHSM